MALATALVATFVTTGFARTRVEVLAVDSELTEANGVATARFKIQVTNHEDASLTGVRAVFAGGAEVAVGDVAAGAAVVSAPQKFLFNASDLPATKNVPLQVTLKFSLNGEGAELPALLTIRRAE